MLVRDGQFIFIVIARLITMKYLIAILFLTLFSVNGFAQSESSAIARGPAMKPGIPASKAEVKYPDSTAFNAEFKELYPLIKPTPTVSERTDRTFEMMSRMFKARGVDSAKAYEAVMKSVDKSMDQKILFDEYRKNFTAEELKSIIAFYKSPAGKHFLEVEGPLMQARGQAIDSYVHREIAMTITPLMKPVTPQERGAMNHGIPPGHPGAPGMGAPHEPPANSH